MPHPIDAAKELADLAERMVRERYRRENPSASESELDAMIDRWLRTRPGAEHRDAEGRVVTLPRAR